MMFDLEWPNGHIKNIFIKLRFRIWDSLLEAIVTLRPAKVATVSDATLTSLCGQRSSFCSSYRSLGPRGHDADEPVTVSVVRHEAVGTSDVVGAYNKNMTNLVYQSKIYDNPMSAVISTSLYKAKSVVIWLLKKRKKEEDGRKCFI